MVPKSLLACCVPEVDLNVLVIHFFACYNNVGNSGAGILNLSELDWRGEFTRE